MIFSAVPLNSELFNSSAMHGLKRNPGVPLVAHGDRWMGSAVFQTGEDGRTVLEALMISVN